MLEGLARTFLLGVWGKGLGCKPRFRDFGCFIVGAQDGQGRFLHFPVLGFALELHSEITTAKSMELYPCPCRYLRVTAQKPAESDAPAVEPKKSKNSCAAIEISTAYPSASQTAGSATSLNPKPFSSNCGLQTLHKTSTHPTNPETGKNTVGLCRDRLVDKRLPRLRGAENELPGGLRDVSYWAVGF